MVHVMVQLSWFMSWFSVVVQMSWFSVMVQCHGLNQFVVVCGGSIMVVHGGFMVVCSGS